MGIELVRVEPASYRMVVYGDREPHADAPRHQVTITRPFFIGRTEVTKDQWREVMGQDPSTHRDCGGDCPVEHVSWYDALEFCNRLSEREGLAPVYEIEGDEVSWDQDAPGYRLPTDGEWELAALGGTTTRWHTGDHPEDGLRAGWFQENAERSIHPAGRKEPNALGLVDMHGNVWEWVWDRWAPYPDHPVTDPTGPVQGEERVHRGGSVAYSVVRCRASHHLTAPSRSRIGDLGLRVARNGN